MGRSEEVFRHLSNVLIVISQNATCIVFFFALFAFCVRVKGEEIQFTDREQVMAKVLENNRELLAQAYRIEVARGEEDREYGAFWPSVTIYGKSDQRHSPKTSTFEPQFRWQAITRQSYFQSSASLLTPTGATIEIGTVMTRNTTTLFAELNPEYKGEAYARISQPLLKGFGPKITRAPRRLANIKVGISNNDYLILASKLLIEAEIQYWTLAYGRSLRDFAGENLALSKELLRQATVREKNGVLTRMDINSAAVQVQARQQDIFAADNLIENSKSRLAYLMGIVDPIEVITPSLSPDTIEANAPADSALSAYENYSQRLKYLAAAEIKLAIAKDKLLPDLRLAVDQSLLTREATIKRAITRFPDLAGDDLKVELTLDIPFLFKKDRAGYRGALAEYRAEKELLAAAADLHTSETRRFRREFNLGVEKIKTAQETASLARENLMRGKKRLELGDLTYVALRQIEADYEIAALTRLNHIYELLIARSKYREFDGSFSKFIRK